MATEGDQEDFACLASQEEQDKFVKLCGDGDLGSVTQLLADNPSLLKARESDWGNLLSNIHICI